MATASSSSTSSLGAADAAGTAASSAAVAPLRLRLVRELAHQLEGRSKLPAPEPELQAPIAAAVEAFHLPLHLDAKPHSPSQKRSKQASVTHAHGPRRRGGCCALLLRLVCFFALLALGTYLWRHHVSPWNKDLFYKLSQPVRAGLPGASRTWTAVPCT